MHEGIFKHYSTKVYSLAGLNGKSSGIVIKREATNEYYAPIRCIITGIG